MTNTERESLFKAYLADCSTEEGSPKAETLQGYYGRFKKAWNIYADGEFETPFEVEDELSILPIKKRAVTEDGDGDTRRGFELYYSFLAESRFKALLEWFVTQLKINNGIIEGKPTGGYGYKGNEIRQRYKAWRSYEGFDLDCSLRCDVPHSIANYIHYTDSWINIVPVFIPVDGKHDVSGLKIILKPNNAITKEYPVISVNELGLFDNSFPNHQVRVLFKEFKKEIMELQTIQKNTIVNPNQEEHFAELQLKLGIKSSLPNVKAAMALLLALWRSGAKSNGYVYGVEQGDNFIPSSEVVKSLSDYFGKPEEEIKAAIEKNPLYTSQIEALQVAFELCWRIAKFEFENSSFPFSAERTGGRRYAKKISYTRNIDVVSVLIESDEWGYKEVLLSWLKQGEALDDSFEVYEEFLRRILTVLSEECVYRIRTDAQTTYTFRNYGIYDALQKNCIVNISDYKEQVGPLRILSSIVTDGLNYYIQKTNGGVELSKDISLEDLSSYSERIKNYISLTDIKLSFVETKDADEEDSGNGEIVTYAFESSKGGAQNKVIYGTPGCGKSYYVKNKLLPLLGIAEDKVFRTTFYQDYTNTEFVGQILPKVQPDKSVTYEFNPGPFTLALQKAIEHPDVAVALVIEELNRGNAASIFGDIFQLLDRDKNGRSEYDITNVNIQDYLNKCFAEQNIKFDKIRIPANLYIIATMNTSDQNVFTLDTAFKRRWLFEKIRNEFDDTHEYKGYYVPGMASITWQKLVEDINEFIINRPDDLSSEDKLIGVYFIEKSTLCEKMDECSNEEKKRRFAYKLFEYLWDDVAKFTHSEWFGTDIKSLDQLIYRFMTDGEQVLKNVLKL